MVDTKNLFIKFNSWNSVLFTDKLNLLILVTVHCSLLVIDVNRSTWELGIHYFFDWETQFPQFFRSVVENLHQQGSLLTVWVMCMIMTLSFKFDFDLELTLIMLCYLDSSWCDKQWAVTRKLLIVVHIISLNLNLQNQSCLTTKMEVGTFLSCSGSNIGFKCYLIICNGLVQQSEEVS